MIPDTTLVEHRHWGTCGESGHAPHNLSEFMIALDEAMNEIPREYRMGAEIYFDADYECGETYSSVRITYERQMTKEERTEWIAEERKRIEEMISKNEEWNEARRADLAAIASST